MKLFLKVTRDRYELPLAVARTQAELARIIGVDKTAVSKGLRKENSAYKKVEVEDDEYLCSGKKYKAALPNEKHHPARTRR